MSKIENISINEGQDVEFICKFISFPLANNIMWFKNESEELLDNEKYKIVSSDELTTLKITLTLQSTTLDRSETMPTYFHIEVNFICLIQG